jgi:hypothetical protein
MGQTVNFILEHFRFRLKHLMETNQSTLLGAKRSAILVSGKFCNDADGLIWPTKGLFFTPAGQRYDLLVVIKTTAQFMPCQQT